MILLCYKNVFLILLEEKDFLNYFRLRSSKISMASQMLSSAKYIEI